MEGKQQLFLLHFAGGNCYSYQFLKPLLQDRFEFFALELPGRGKRFNVETVRSRQEAIADYISQIKALRNGGPFSIYGHSMGAALGFEVAVQMEQERDVPNSLIVTGYAGPNIYRDKTRYNLSYDAFLETLQDMGGMPQEILDNTELLTLFIPILRSDFEVVEKSRTSITSCLKNVPIYSVMGDVEEQVDKITNWDEYTQATHKSQIMKGGHFFIHDHPKELAEIIIEASQQTVL